MRIHRSLKHHASAATDGQAQARRARRGFALPMAILVIAFLTVTLAAAYMGEAALASLRFFFDAAQFYVRIFSLMRAALPVRPRR